MRVELNGEVITPRTDNLADLLNDCGYENGAVATAVNGQFVPRSRRSEITLTDGDKIEVLAPMQGG